VSEQRELGQIVAADVILDRDGVFLSVCVDIRFDGSGQAFSGYCLDTYDKVEGRRVGTAPGADFIRQVLEALRITRFRDAAGIVVWVERENGLIVRIERPGFDRPATHFDVREWRKQWGLA
jgi:hypothetical protein